MQIQKLDAFSIPIFQVPVPEMQPYHREIMEYFQGLIDTGKLKPHQHGHGYQTPTNLFFPGAYPQTCFLEVLGPAFVAACEQILQHAQVDSGQQAGRDFVWFNTLTVGWANIQTKETWNLESPWHSHLPAILSGCYYVSTSSNRKEGNLQFESPLMANLFHPRVIEIVPRPGQLILFPSFLRHRPSPCPSTGQTRIALCMDSHWTVQLAGQLPPELRGK